MPKKNALVSYDMVFHINQDKSSFELSSYVFLLLSLAVVVALLIIPRLNGDACIILFHVDESCCCPISFHRSPAEGTLLSSIRIAMCQ
jgi:hypothetical protein